MGHLWDGPCRAYDVLGFADAAGARHAAPGAASQVLYESRPCISRPTPVTGSRNQASGEERRLEPQITIGLLTDASVAMRVLRLEHRQ
jgi:hypothetical protein